MRSFLNLSDSIRVKLTLIIVLNSGLALLLAGVALFAYENFEQRQSAARHMSAQAGIIAESSTAALSFNDKRAGEETLAALRGDSEILEAVIYDRLGHPFSRYVASGSVKTEAPGTQEDGVHFEAHSILIFRSILLGGEKIGTIFLKSAGQMEARLRRYTRIVCLTAILSLGLALLLSSKLQGRITKPITELSAVACSVSVNRDYAIRANRNAGGEIGTLIDSFNDMLSQIETRDTARRVAEESLRESEERYALAARGANGGLWDWNFTTGRIYFSHLWSKMLGYSHDEVWSDPEDWFTRIHPADRQRVKAEISFHLDGAKPEFISEYRMLQKDQTYLWVLNRGIAVRNSNGIAVRMAGSQTDINNGKIGDPLTGLPNRLFLMERLDVSLQTAQHQNGKLAVLFVDLDKFKQVNDSLGHAAGDSLLIGVATRLLSSVGAVARVDGAARQAVVARLGGDEFAILLNDIRGAEDAGALATCILNNLAEPFQLEGRPVFAGASIGIALSATGSTPEELLRNADTAMYQAKACGRSRFEIFDEKMRERAVARLQVETDLRKAVAGNQLTLHYQPQTKLRGRRVSGYEALVRWNHPERGLLGPDHFIPVAEESDLIVHLGRWVLKEACRQMAEWHRDFTFERPPTISVNISARQLSDPRLLDDVQQTLFETGLDPRCLKLEVTESSLMGDPEIALRTLRSLKLMNIGLEIDDFGTGYSSLSYLQRFPFDTVKIDRSFVREMGERAENSEIIRTILDLANSLNMHVVAEGVETKDQVDRLAALGCDCVQGFYFSKPIIPQSVTQQMKERSMLNEKARLEKLIPADPASLRNIELLVH